MIAILILGALLFSSSLNGQQPRNFDPFPNGLAAAYHFDLAKNFFPSPKAAATAREDLAARAGRLRAQAKQPVTSGEVLLDLLAANDTLDLFAGRQYAYLTLRGAIDTRDSEAQGEMAALAGALNPAGRDVARIIGDLSSAQFQAFAAAEPRLAKYQYAAALAWSSREHELGPTNETLVSLQSLATTWGPALFQSTLSSIDWGTVSTNGQMLDVRRNGNEIRNHPDRGVRERGYTLGQAGIASRLDVFASILTRTAAARNTLSQKRRWPDYPAEAYASGALDTKTVRSLLQSVAARASINKRYEQKRIDEIRREFG